MFKYKELHTLLTVKRPLLPPFVLITAVGCILVIFKYKLYLF